GRVLDAKARAQRPDLAARPAGPPARPRRGARLTRLRPSRGTWAIMEAMDETTVAAYLDRIGATRPPVLDGAALGALHRAHLLTVPFENLSIHLAEPISLAEGDLADKIVTRRRGGFCYELNGTFALLLEALGANVVRAAARVYGDGRLGPPFDHLTLIVRL